MAERYFDPDPTPSGYPRPAGDLASLSRFRQPRDLRGRQPIIPDDATDDEVRNMMIAHAVLAWDLSHRRVGAAIGLSRSRVSDIIAEAEEMIQKQLKR